MGDNETTESGSALPKFWVGFLFVAVSLLVWFLWPITIVERIDLGYNREYGFVRRYVDVTPLHTYVSYHLVILSIAAGWGYWLFCIHRVHDVMAKATNGEHPVAPKRAVWAHVIPVYNLYWVFKWPNEIANSIYKSSYQVISDRGYGIVLFLAFLSQYTILIDVVYLIPSAREAIQKATGFHLLGILSLAIILRAIGLAAAVLGGITVSKAIGRMIVGADAEETRSNGLFGAHQG
jgi:hypothetical protein